MSSCSQPSLPKPEEYGWKMGESGLEIDWHGEDFVPKELLDIMLDDDENVNGDQISESLMMMNLMLTIEFSLMIFQQFSCLRYFFLVKQ